MHLGVLWVQPAVFLALGLLWMSLFLAFFHFIQYLSVSRRRWPVYRVKHRLNKRRFLRLLSAVLHVPLSGRKLEEKGQLLKECGFSVGAAEYALLHRFLTLFCAAAALFSARLSGGPSFLPFSPLILSVFFLAAFIVLLMDRALLETIRRHRRRRIVREIYVISRQLLYYSGSKMNLHSKLMRCLPFAGAIRKDLERLLNEWYAGAEEAIARFKAELGTEEGYSFAETLNSLRLYDTEHYYELLRQRIRDYKEKIELLRESRKETLSYVLFVLSGIPILYTFRVFLYPWVAQGQKLLDALN